MAILSQERLLELTGLKQRAALRRHLRRAGVVFKEVNGRILTTEEAFGVGSSRVKEQREPNWGARHVRN